MHTQDIVTNNSHSSMDTNIDKIAEYERVIKELEYRLRVAEIKPIINRIIDSKLRLGKIKESDIDNEMARYANSSADILEELASVYEELESITNKSAIAMRKDYRSSRIALSANKTIVTSPNTNDTIYADAILMV